METCQNNGNPGVSDVSQYCVNSEVYKQLLLDNYNIFM